MSNMAASVGVNPRVSQNLLQQAQTEHVPRQLGVPRLVVVEMSHHLADIAVHIDGDFPVLQARENMV